MFLACKLADAHKMLESACATFALRGIWAAMAGTTVSTSRASSFKQAKNIAKFLRYVLGLQVGRCPQNVGERLRNLCFERDLGCDGRHNGQNVRSIHPSSSWGFDSSSAAIPFTRWLSLSSKRVVLSPTSSSPLLFHIARLVYAVAARI